MLSILLAVTAALAEPNSRNFSLEPFSPCLGGGVDPLFVTHLADFGPAAITSMLLAAYICGDKIESIYVAFNLLGGLLLTAVASLRLYCVFHSGTGAYPKMLDLYFLVLVELLTAAFMLMNFVLVLVYRPGPGTPAEMLYEPLLELCQRPTFRHIFVQVVSQNFLGTAISAAYPFFKDSCSCRGRPGATGRLLP